MEYIFICLCLLVTFNICRYSFAIQKENDTNDISPNHDSDFILSLPESKIFEPKEMPMKYKDLLRNIIKIKNQCGGLCRFDYSGEFKEISSGKTFRALKKEVKCNDLWNNSIFDQPSTIKFPIQKLPSYLIQYFNHNGRVKILPDYRDDTNTENDKTNRWGKFQFYRRYNTHEIKTLMDLYTHSMH